MAGPSIRKTRAAWTREAARARPNWPAVRSRTAQRHRQRTAAPLLRGAPWRSLRQVLVQRGALDAPRRSDLLARQFARFEDREYVAFRDLQAVGDVAGREELGESA